MGLLRKDDRRRHWFRPGRSSRGFKANLALRVCRFEQMEPRRLLAVDFLPIQVGAVYFEDQAGIGADQAGDVFEITFSGGAPGTQLTELIIDTDKEGSGYDCFFDTQASQPPVPPGVSGAAAFNVCAGTTGIDSIDSVSVVDGGKLLVITFTGFDPGDRLVFSIDVDEEGWANANPIAEGAEFEGSVFSATFAADHFYEASGSDFFYNAYDFKLGPSGLPLPPDEYREGECREEQTAGAIFSVTQQPLPITVAGTVFEDINLDNTQDAGEPGLQGVTLTLYELVGSSYTATAHMTTTNAQGDYLFENVLPGTYQIVETQPAGYFSIGASAGTVAGAPRGVVTSPDVISEVTLLGGEDSIDNDFAEALPASLAGHVYHDLNDNGVMDDGEAGIGGVSVSVQYLPPEGLLPPAVTVVTLADGSWSLGNLMPGDYRVTEDQPEGYFDGQDAAGTAGGTAHNPGDMIDGFRLLSGQAGEDYDFGELMPSSISGRVFVDSDNNGVYNSGDILLPNVTVYLLDDTGNTLQTMQTDAKGEYVFGNLHHGVYGVEEVQPGGYFDGPDYVGSYGGSLLATDSIIDIDLPVGADAVRYDFSEWLPSSLGGSVFLDLNGNYVYDKGDQLLSGVTIHLLDPAGGTLKTMQTDVNGQYLFEGLAPGTYGVEEVQPAEYYDGPDKVGSAGGSLLAPDSIIDIVLDPGTDAVQYDFCEIPLVSISGHVYVDDNNNGLFDGGEKGLAGVELVLLDGTGKATGKKTTDAAGFYRFEDLLPGTYSVTETQPIGYFDGLDTAGSVGGTAHNPGDMISNVVLKPGVDAENYNFGELRPASISGHVHGDLNGDCYHDPNEPWLAGVTIYLLDASGNRLRATTTDANGQYIFSGLEPGTYGVEEIQPAGYLQGRTHPGSAGGWEEQPDLILGAELGSGVDAIDYNFCEATPASISGYVFQDGPAIVVLPFSTAPDPATVRDGRFTPDDTPIPGVVLYLCDGSGAPLLDASGHAITAVTNANGYYQFTMLERGLYSILQMQPQQYTDSIDTAGSKGGSPVNPHSADYQAIVQRFSVNLRDDAIVDIWLNMGDVATSYNFSEVAYEEAPLYIPTEGPPSTPLPAPPQAIPFASEAAPVMFFPLPPEVQRQSMFGGSGEGGYTWHLSVIDAGRPRGQQSAAEVAYNRHNRYFDPVNWTNVNLRQSQWIIADAQGNAIRELLYGMPDAIPVAGDFNGDGIAEVGVYIAGNWFIDLNGNGIWDEEDFWAFLGSEDDLPVVGDWDGDGKDDIGIFGPAWVGDFRAVAAEPGLPDAGNRPTGRYKNIPPDPQVAAIRPRTMKRTAQSDIRADLVDHVFRFGAKGDQPVAGDWNGDGAVSIGIFRDGTWYLDVDGDGRWTSDDATARLGEEGDTPVVGDFNGDGIDDLGVYRAGTWYLDTNGNRKLDAQDKVFELGGPHDRPVVADFNGDGTDEIAVYQDHIPGPTQAAR